MSQEEPGAARPGSADEVERRKGEHLQVASTADVGSRTGPGWPDVHLLHSALPVTDLVEVDLSVDLLGRRLAAPLVIASMTGGHRIGIEVNRRLARAAERHGLAMGGDPRGGRDDRGRRPGHPHELSGGDGADRGRPPGERRPPGHPGGGRLVPRAGVAKETGAGISRDDARELERLGVAALDVGGLGGTSFSALEGVRAAAAGDDRGARLGEVFRDWGIPTAVSIVAAAAAGLPVIGTGGVRTGLDAAKAMALGATAVGVARPLLAAALEGDEALDRWIAGFLDELRVAVFLSGRRSAAELAGAPRVLTGETRRWLEDLGYLGDGDR